MSRTNRLPWICPGLEGDFYEGGSTILEQRASSAVCQGTGRLSARRQSRGGTAQGAAWGAEGTTAVGATTDLPAEGTEGVEAGTEGVEGGTEVVEEYVEA